MDGPRNDHAKWSQPDNETPTSNAFTECAIWKKDSMNFFAEQILTHRLWKTYGFQRRQVGGGGMGRKSYKIGCDDHCTIINVINSLNNQKIELKNKQLILWKFNLKLINI